LHHFGERKRGHCLLKIISAQLFADLAGRKQPSDSAIINHEQVFLFEMMQYRNNMPHPGLTQMTSFEHLYVSLRLHQHSDPDLAMIDLLVLVQPARIVTHDPVRSYQAVHAVLFIQDKQQANTVKLHCRIVKMNHLGGLPGAL
jgi:hypothetical protein